MEYDHRCDIMMYLFVTVLRLAWLVVGVLVGVVVGHGHLAELVVRVLVGVVVGHGHLAELVVGVLVGVVVGQGHLAELVDGVLVRFVVRQGHLAELLLMGGELQGKHGLNCYRSQGEGILKGGSFPLP